MNRLFKDSKVLSRVGNNFFNIGIFLLPSAFFFAIFFLLISFIIANIKNTAFFKDKWNIPFLICSFLMILICLVSSFSDTNLYNVSLEKNLNWLGLLNWIPMFWVFWCSQYYLKDCNRRKSCALFLVLGTIPILISGFGQYYFEWYGPIKFLNGSIIWYQRASDNQIQSLTGPFNNPNYAGAWLTVVFPFCFFFICQSKKFAPSKIFYSFLTSATLLAAFLTHSRNAILNITLALFLLIGISSKLIFFTLSLIVLTFALIFIFKIPLNFLDLVNENKIFSGFIPTTNKISEILNFTRIKIWKTAIFNIFRNPLMGWGASSFSTLYLIKHGKPTFQHTHNIILEISHNYGIVVSLILFSTIFLLIYKSKLAFSSKEPIGSSINKFWWVSSLVILLMNFTDITYYDGRISLLFWILISGLRCILRENNLKKIKLN